MVDYMINEEYQCEHCGNEVSRDEFEELSSDLRYAKYDTYFIVHKYYCLSAMDNYYDIVLVKRETENLALVDAYNGE